MQKKKKKIKPTKVKPFSFLLREQQKIPFVPPTYKLQDRDNKDDWMDYKKGPPSFFNKKTKTVYMPKSELDVEEKKK